MSALSNIRERKFTFEFGGKVEIKLVSGSIEKTTWSVERSLFHRPVYSSISNVITFEFLVIF